MSNVNCINLIQTDTQEWTLTDSLCAAGARNIFRSFFSILLETLGKKHWFLEKFTDQPVSNVTKTCFYLLKQNV